MNDVPMFEGRFGSSFTVTKLHLPGKHGQMSHGQGGSSGGGGSKKGSVGGASLPSGHSAKSVAAGRSDAKRWEIYKGDKQDYDSWVGDLVNWKDPGNNHWEWQPRGGGTMRQSPTAQGAMGFIGKS